MRYTFPSCYRAGAREEPPIRTVGSGRAWSTRGTRRNALPEYAVRWKRLGVSLVVLVALLPDRSAAEFQISASVSLAERNADLAYNAASHLHLIVWQRAAIVMGAFCSESCTEGTLGKPFVILGDSPVVASYTDPAVAYEPGEGVYVVVARKTNLFSTTANIVAQRVAADGALVGSTITLSDAFPSSSLEGRPAVAAATAGDPDNRILAVWRQGDMMWGRFADSGGTTAGDAFAIGDPLARMPAVAYQASPNEGYLVAFQAVSGDDEPYIATKLVLRSGFVVPDPMRVSSEGRVGRHPDIVYSEVCQRYLVVWDEEGQFSISKPFVASGAIRGQLLEFDWITKAGENFTIRRVPFFLGLSGSVDSPVVTAKATSNDFVVAYSLRAPQAFPWAGRDRDLFGKRVNGEGATAVVAPEFDIIDDAAGNDENPALSFGGPFSNLLVVWERQPGASTSFDIYGTSAVSVP